MSSNRIRSSLPAQITILLMLLLAAGCVSIAVPTYLNTRQFLQDELDANLAEAAKRTVMMTLHPPPGAKDLASAPGQNPGMISANVVDGDLVDGGWVDRDGTFRHLNAEQFDRLWSSGTGETPKDVDLGELGRYRVVAVQPEPGRVVISGLSLANLDRTMTNLGSTMAAVSGLAMAAVGTIGVLLLRRRLRPLRTVSRAAFTVAELPLGDDATTGDIRMGDDVLQDGTEVGTVGRAFNRMLENVDQALLARQHTEEQLRRFVADASHELRTPLASVRGYSELAMRQSGLPVQAAFSLNRINAEAQRMSTLVDELLLLAHLDADDGSAHFAPVDVALLLTECVADLSIIAADHRWLLDTPGRDTSVLGNENQLRQVVLNLLGNARNHTPPGTTVTSRLAVVGDQVTLTVGDDGPGIPEADREHIFARFARGDRSRSRTNGTTGLGLAIVAAVVTAHHGTVALESRPGHTTFTIAMPIVQR